MMEMELEPRVKPLGYKVKAMSRESPAQKAVNVLDPDLRTHWSTATNNKEWILLELDEPCLLSHLRIYNKSVLEWEITVGLRYKPETFVKIRPRCEAPRRDMIYPTNYMPCRYVRISCLRGNPIAIYFIQLVGVSVIGLEPEFQPIVNYLLPNIISHKQDAHDMYLQLLQDVTKHLLVFLPQLEGDLNNFADAPESNILFFAMLAGPFYPILHLVNERKSARSLLSSSDQDAAKSNPSSPLTISSNFEAQPRRVRSPLPFGESSFGSIVFRSDAVIMLLRKAYKDRHLGIVCRRASRVLHMLVEPSTTLEETLHSNDLNNQITDELEIINPVHIGDYSSLFGEEFTLLDGQWDASYLNVLDVVAAEESILHFLYGCAAQPLLCGKLAESNADFWFLLPLLQALLPALRPPITCPPDQVDDTFWQWKHPSGHHAIYQIVTMLSSSVYRPLLHACAGYLSSLLSSHAKAACVLIDLCSGPLAPWIPVVTAKVDLVIELVEDLLGVIQDARRCLGRARAALKYILLALSGHVDDVLAVYKEVKHRLLFLLEMLEPFLDPAITARKDMISFGDNSTTYSAKQERTCAVALNIIRTALQRPAILPSLESEWRRGSVAPSVILSVLGPHVPLPLEVDLCKCSESKITDAAESLGVNSSNLQGTAASFPNEAEAKIDIPEGSAQKDVLDDSHLLFAPTELKNSLLLNSSTYSVREGSRSEADYDVSEGKHVGQSSSFQPNTGFSIDYIDMHADYLQLVDYQDSDFRASEFKRLAADLYSQPNITPDSHDAAIDTLLLAAECYTNPFFMLSFKTNSKFASQINAIESKLTEINGLLELNKDHQKYNIHLETIAHLERKRDKDVLRILLHAAKMDLDFQMGTSSNETYANVLEENEQVLELFPLDVDSADAVTLVRKNQTLLCHFVTRQLSRGQQSSHEILLQTLLFLLHSATELSCSPDDVIDIILESAENLDGQIAFLYNELKAQNMHCNLENLHGVRRRWKILQKLVMEASGNDSGGDNIGNTLDNFRYRSLIPHSSWMHKISKFTNSSCPLARFLGWMAVSRYAKAYVKERLFLASDLSELALLLSIFADELTLTDNVLKNKNEDAKSEPSYNKSNLQGGKEVKLSCHTDSQKSFHVLYPYLHMFFPSMKKQFVAFGEIILEAVGLQLKCLSYDAVPDVLHWLADLCLWPYRETLKEHISVSSTAGSLKGYTARNAKAVVLYVLESVVVGHMEAMIPELPRIAQILTSLCRASYCDVAFLDSVLSILDPLLSYCISKSTDAENMFTEFSLYHGFELSCFEEIFDGIRHRKGSDGTTGENEFVGSLLIFFLAYLFPSLSFRRKKEILESITLWVEFTTSEPTSSFYDYLTALQKFMNSCQTVLVQALRNFSVEFPFEKKQGDCNLNIVDSPGVSGRSFMLLSQKQFEDRETDDGLVSQWIHNLPVDEIKEFLDTLVNLVSKLIPAIEASWTLHHKLARNLVFTSSECLLFSRCLSLVIPLSDHSGDADGGNINQSNSEALSSACWSTALEGVISAMYASQKNHCWQVASSMVEYLLTLPESISFDSGVSTLCLVIKNFCQYAPRISWRLLAGKWITSLLARGILKIDVSANPLVDLFCAMLGHSEPEQRSVAVQHLGTVVGLENYDGAALQLSIINQKLKCSGSVVSIPESIVSVVVTKTWDRVITIAFSDPSIVLRTHAAALLLGYIPYAERSQLQAFLSATSTYLRGVGKGTYSIEEGHLTRLSLHLLGSACLYASAEDIMLVPESVWRNIENMAISRTTVISDTEKKLCVALSKVRTESDNAKVALKEVMSSEPTAKPSDPSVQSVRESILQVLASLTTVQSYFDFFSKRSDQQSQELEEAEIEMELLNKEKAAQEVSGVPFQEPLKYITLPHDRMDNSRLQQIKDDIRSIERSKIREEVIVRRQKRLLMRHARQKYLEEAALHEMELLQELDRERANELERDIERQRELQLERTKTRDLQLNLDMEKERMRQKELQRELEQIESGVRAPRREISSNPSSRARERYRERENGRSGQEGTLRSSSRDHDGVSLQVPAGDTRGSSPVPTVVLSGSRSFSGQLPTILQSRERTDDRSISYEDSFEGSRDSGDTNSIGDPELASAFDGSPGPFGSASRHGPRGGSKSRQIVERRDREARREGKWERKHS